MTVNQRSIAIAFAPWHRAATVIAAKDAPLSLDAPDICPYCKTKMLPTLAVGIPVFICEDDRHVAPARNTEAI